MDDKFGMNFPNFDPDSLFNPHLGGLHLGGVKRNAHEAGLDEPVKKEDSWPWGANKDPKSGAKADGKSHSARDTPPQTGLEDRPPSQPRAALPNGKKTKGRVKIKMEFIDNKLRRYTTFSKRKTGIMKKAYELSTLTGTQVMLLVASETGHVYTFATRKLQPMITSEAGKALIQTCLNSPDPPSASGGSAAGAHGAHSDQRMSATGYEETELTYAVADDEHKSPPPGGAEEYFNGSSYSGSDSSSPPTPALSPPHNPTFSFGAPSPAPVTSSGSGTPGISSSAFPVHLAPGLVLTPSDAGSEPEEPPSTSTPSAPMPSQCLTTHPNLTPLTILKSPSGGGMVVGSPGGSLMYSPSGGVVYAPNSPLPEGAPTSLLLNLPQGLQVTSDQGTSVNPQLVTLPMNLASAAVAAASALSGAGVGSTPPSESLPTDLSLHVKRENRS